MSEILSVQFTCQNKIYTALVRCTRLDGEMQIRVTVMDGAIEKLISGHHIFIVNEGKISPAKECTDQDIRNIQAGIINCLEHSKEFENLYCQHFIKIAVVEDQNHPSYHSNLIGEPPVNQFFRSEELG